MSKNYIEFLGVKILESDVKKIRSFPKKKLDTIDDYNIYVSFLQLMSSSSYHENCKGIYLLNYMEKYRKDSELILPMKRFLINGDDKYFTNPPLKYRLAL